MLVELLNRHPQVSDRNVLHYTGSKDNPAQQINLRAIDPERYTIINEANNGEVLEEIEESNAFWEVYDGAVYLYQVTLPPRTASCCWGPARRVMCSRLPSHRCLCTRRLRPELRLSCAIHLVRSLCDL